MVHIQIDVLGEVVKAVEGRVEVYLDGGVRQGTDVLKALALGAKAVFIGRPVLWGLAYQVSTVNIVLLLWDAIHPSKQYFVCIIQNLYLKTIFIHPLL